MISDQPEPKGPLPAMVPFDFTYNSARLLFDGKRYKAMIVFDVTDLNEEGRAKFISRAEANLTRMGIKIMEGAK